MCIGNGCLSLKALSKLVHTSMLNCWDTVFSYDLIAYAPLNLVNVLHVPQLIVSMAKPLPGVDHQTSNEREVTEVPQPSVQGIL